MGYAKFFSLISFFAVQQAFSQVEILESAKVSKISSLDKENELHMDSSKQEPKFVHVEHIAKYKSGMNELYAFIGSKVKYPVRCIELGLEGTVIVEFVVEKDGRLSNVEALTKHKTCPEMNEESIRVVKLTSGKWKPADQNGTSVRSKYRLPIRFDME